MKATVKTKGIPVISSRLVSITTCVGFITASSCLSSVPASSQNAHHTQAPFHMPQGAFLRSPSPDVAHLVHQVKSDPVVAIRYSRLFHLPVKMVPLAFEQMHLKNLAVDHIMQVHFVRGGVAAKGEKAEKEELVFKMRRVRAGTPVYCLPDGTPILVRVCGNPIRTRVSPEFYSAPIPNFNPRERLIPRPPVDSSITVTPAIAVIPDRPRTTILPIPPLPAIAVVPATDVLPVALLPAAPALPPAALRSASLPPVYTWAHSPNSFLGAVPALGLLSLLSSGRNGSAVPVTPGVPLTIVPPSSPGVPSGPLSSPPDTPPVVPVVPIVPVSPPFVNVPEPGIMAVGLIALLGISYVRFRKRR